MYTSLSESTVLSSADSGPSQVYTFFETSEDFLQFLSGRTGMNEILLHEDTSNVEVKLESDGFGITHKPGIPVKPIELSLRKLYYDVEFTRCLRLSKLNARCAASQELYLTPAQYALLHESKLAVTRSAGLAEVFMDTKGRVCMYGSVESVIDARITLKKMFSDHGIDDTTTHPPAPSLDRDSNNNRISNTVTETTPTKQKSAGGWSPAPLYQVADTPSTPTHVPPMGQNSENVENAHSRTSSSGPGNSLNQSCSLNSVGNGSGMSPESEYSNAAPANITVEPKHGNDSHRKSLRFFVNLTDAPRLIGSRGTNKRRIEQVTGCTIVLHTEKKENGEFPIEVFSSSTKRCEIARQHILGFLSNSQATEDSNISSQSRKEIRVRPKVHLDFSPKKLHKKHSE